MKASWDDLNARAQGLSTRLLGARAIAELAAGAQLEELARRLDRKGFGPLPPAATAAMLEAAVRRSAADGLQILARWTGERSEVLAAIFEDEDRRSLRALVRGAAAGAPPEARLSGLVPTPALPPRALEELARLAEVAQLAATLEAWGNPYAEALRPTPALPRADLMMLETALSRTFAERARAGARGGDRALAEYVSESIDVENALAAVVLAPRREKAERYFVPGGRALSQAAFVEAAGAADRDAAVRRLSVAFAGTLLAEALAGRPAALERRFLAARIRAHARAARLQPLTSQPLLSYALRLRAETLDLRAVIWSVALGAPPPPMASPP